MHTSGIIRRFTCTALSAAAFFTMPCISIGSVAENSTSTLPDGWLVWHSYSDYSALDSRLFLRSPEGDVSEISGSFIHPMNGNFGTTPDRITFMAIDPVADEWDIYIYDNTTGNVTDLTENSGLRNEDPKWSPDGESIVFKRGRWDSSINDMKYDLALMDVDTREVTMLTDDITEEAMPCFSADGSYIYYAAYSGRIGSIKRMELSTGITETVFSEAGVNAYYPVTFGTDLFFTSWFSADNRHDRIMMYDGSSSSPLPFNSENYDCSDICPVSINSMIYSSTQNGEYDLYYYDGSSSVRLTDINSDKNDLGADFFPAYVNASSAGDINSDGTFNIADAVLLQRWLLTVPDSVLSDWKKADLCADGILDVFDLCAMKKALNYNHAV